MNASIGKTVAHKRIARTVKRPRRNRAMENFSRGHTLAVELAIAVIAPVLVGQWLDSRTGKAPWFTIGGLVLGGAASIRSALRAASEWRKQVENDDEAADRESGKQRATT